MHRTMRATGVALVLSVVAACGGDDSPPSTEVTTERCDYLPMPATANASRNVGGSVPRFSYTLVRQPS